jgi:MFS family permease
MQTVLHVDPKKVFITFAIVCITAPVFGVITGGFFIQKLGGYTNKRALEACFKIAILAAASGLFLPLIDNFPLFVILIWLLLFFGGSIVPGLTGIMLSAAPEKTKEIANSVTHLCYNLLGYLPSPFLYGLVCKYTGGSTSRYGLAFILLWSLFGLIFLFTAKYFQDKKTFEKEKDKAESTQSASFFETPSSSKPHPENDEKEIEEKSEILTALYGRISLTKYK